MDKRALRLRRVLLVFATGAGAAGVCLLYATAAASYQMDCACGILGVMMPGLASLVSLATCALLFLVADVVQRRYRVSVAAFVTILLTLVAFDQVIMPRVSEQRALRHAEEMKEKLPALDAIVSQVEAKCETLEHIPADNNEFLKILMHDVRHDDRMNGGCWSIDYSKVDSESYELRFTTFYLEYAYDSRTPERGWYAIATTTQR